jgi:small subunit ribosomal protein S15
MLTPKEKGKIIEGAQTHESDTGSPEVQVALLSKEIDKLLTHLKEHKKDFHSKRGLLKMVAKRRTFLQYLKNEDEKRYRSLMKKVGLKNK